MVSDTNRVSGGKGQLFPALCLHDDGAGKANGYSIDFYESSGVQVIELVKIASNVTTTLAQATGVVFPGSTISLGYTWTGSSAILYVYIDGELIITKTD